MNKQKLSEDQINSIIDIALAEDTGRGDVTSEALIEAGMQEEIAKATVPVLGKGCRVCSNTGYKGRVAVYEVMQIKEELKGFVLNGASALELKREAIRLGMKTLRQCALSKLAEGGTTLSEVVRVSAPDH